MTKLDQIIEYKEIQQNGREVDEKSIRESFNLRQKLQHKPYTEPVRTKADMIIVAKKKEKNDDNDMYEYCTTQRDRTEKDIQQFER